MTDKLKLSDLYKQYCGAIKELWNHKILTDQQYKNEKANVDFMISDYDGFEDQRNPVSRGKLIQYIKEVTVEAEKHGITLENGYKHDDLFGKSWCKWK